MDHSVACCKKIPVDVISMTSLVKKMCFFMKVEIYQIALYSFSLYTVTDR